MILAAVMGISMLPMTAMAMEEAPYAAEAVENTADLKDEELKQIDAIRKELGTQFCRRCNYCQPCTVGINISGAFLFEGYLRRYDLGDWARSRYATLAKKAGDCIGCGECETRCPYNLPIREMLARCKEAFGE